MLINHVSRLDTSRYKSIIMLVKGGWLQKEFEKRGFETHIIAQKGILDLSWFINTLRLIKTKKISLIHSHEFTMNVYGVLAATLAGITCVTTVHGKNYYPEIYRRRVAYRIVSVKSTMVAVSEDTRKYLISQIGISPKQLLTIQNGIEANTYTPSLEIRRIARKEFGLQNGQISIGCVANLYPIKGHVYLIEAAKLVLKIYPDTIFLIAGRGGMLRELQTISKNLDIEDKIRFIGFCENIPSFLQALDIFVLPSLSEGLPISILEAMAAGKPVIASNVGGVHEAVVDGETGFLVPPTDVEALAGKLIFLIADRKLSVEMGNRGRTKAMKEFDLGLMTEKYQQIYEQIERKFNV